VVPAFIAAGYPWVRLSDEGFFRPGHHSEAVKARKAQYEPLRRAFLEAAKIEYPQHAELFKVGQNVRSVLSFEYARRHCDREHWMRIATYWVNTIAPGFLITALKRDLKCP